VVPRDNLRLESVESHRTNRLPQMVQRVFRMFAEKESVLEGDVRRIFRPAGRGAGVLVERLDVHLDRRNVTLRCLVSCRAERDFHIGEESAGHLPVCHAQARAYERKVDRGSPLL
ncbi:uncharacterized protein METZ01_LOCUS165940, partial [marine metagenome]